MKNRYLLPKLLLIGELILLSVTIYMLMEYYFSDTGLLKRTRLHLTFQIIISAAAVLTITRFLQIKGISDKMRKQARDQRVARSRTVESLIFVLLVNILFYGLFFTYSPGRYQPTFTENGTYLLCLLLQFLVIGQMVTLQSDNSKQSSKNNFAFSAAGALAGLLLYITYYTMMT